MKYYLGIDIGASSGRHILGYINNLGNLETIEIYRFKNQMIEENNHLIWDIDYLYNEVLNGIKKAINMYDNIVSLSIDTWGVDYVLLNKDNEVIYPVYAYRDSRTINYIDEVHNLIPFNKLYEITGTQFQQFNTIYQLYTDLKNNRLDNASNYLMIPEYLIYKLTGKLVHEYTNASTTGLLDLNTLSFSEEIINTLGLKKELFFNLTKPGGFKSSLKEDVKEYLGKDIMVTLCATHDTGSAVCALDIDNNSLYISSGTWSLLGVKHEKGINNKYALNANYSNEYGPNYIRLQKNIMGLWIIQNLSKELNISFSDLVIKAKNNPFKEIFNVNDNVFLNTLNMKEEIINWYKRNNINIPNNDGEILFAAINSLAYSYKEAILELELITNKKYDKIYIVGGGAKNELLNELTSYYTNKEVIALPIEATAIGNIKLQMENDYVK